MQALIPADKLRDYIAYARARCHPELTEPAAAKLVDSYLALRAAGTSRKVKLLRFVELAMRLLLIAQQALGMRISECAAGHCTQSSTCPA